MIYLNHAGTSWPKPAPVRAAVAEALSGSPAGWAERLEAQHREVGRALGVADPADLLLTPGATSALAAALATPDWRPGDRVITSGFEHHALQGPVDRLVALGVEVVVAPRGENAAICLDAVEAKLRAGGVRMVATTAACNVTGDLLPIDALGRLAREHGALQLVDAAQVAGWGPLGLAAPGADLLAFAGHKGPQAPWGVGGLAFAPGVAIGPSGARRPGFCDVGSIDRAALAGLVAGLRWLAEPERADRLDVARRRVARLRDALAHHPDVTLYGSADARERMPTLAFRVEGRPAAELAATLAERDVGVSGGLQCAPLAHRTLGTGPDGVVRVSVGPTNEDDDISAAIEILHEALETGSSPVARAQRAASR